jgi:hypothetical protein
LRFRKKFHFISAAPGINVKRIIKELNKFRSLDEMCVVTEKNKVQGKFKDRGTDCLFVEYPSNHADDVYRLLKPRCIKIIESVDPRKEFVVNQADVTLSIVEAPE